MTNRVTELKQENSRLKQQVVKLEKPKKKHKLRAITNREFCNKHKYCSTCPEGKGNMDDCYKVMRGEIAGMAPYKTKEGKYVLIEAEEIFSREEVLFRGKQVQGDSWVYGFLIQNINNFYILINTKIGCVYRLIKPETVGQYTGITDKNSKKIFKGDILKVTDCKRKKTYITKVCTYFNTLCVKACGDSYESTPIGFANTTWDDESYEIEVIGNVYDSPELLELKNDR